MVDPGLDAAIKNEIKRCLHGKGRPISQIAKAHPNRGYTQEQKLADEPTWHEQRELAEYVARRVRLKKEDVVGKSMTNNEFDAIVRKEISHLRKDGMIKDWTKNAGVFRKTDALPPVTKLRMSMKQAVRSRHPGVVMDDDTMKRAFLDMIKSHSMKTYKFALAKALLEYCRDECSKTDPVLLVTYDYLAGKFVEYYWRQAWFKMRQGGAQQRSLAFKAIENTFGERLQPRFQDAKRMHPDKIEEATQQMLKSVFGKTNTRNSIVVHAFQKIRTGRTTTRYNVFYEPHDDEQYLYIYPEAMLFMHRNFDFLHYSVLVKWTVDHRSKRPRGIVLVKVTDQLARRPGVTQSDVRAAGKSKSEHVEGADENIDE